MRRMLPLCLALALVLMATPMMSPVEAKGPCVCPKVYAPVECAKGKVYPNQCVADCRKAKDCAPLGSVAASSDVELPWLDASTRDEVLQCAEERGVSLFAAPLDLVPAEKMMGKGKGNPCKTCDRTLGPCSRVSCSPCCYSCPDSPYLVCTE